MKKVSILLLMIGTSMQTLCQKRKCGINKTDDGVELCFGITDYGEKKYAIEYVVTDFIKSYSDYDGTNFMFINPQMSTFPTDGKVSIRLENGTALDENNAGIWAFGYEGEVQFQQGSIVAYTTSALEDDNDMIVMFRLDKGILPRRNPFQNLLKR